MRAKAKAIAAKILPAAGSIRRRIFFLFGSVGLGAFLVANLIWLPSVTQEIFQNQVELRHVSVQLVRDQIQQYLQDKEDDLTSTAQRFRPSLADGNREAIRLTAQRLLQGNPAFEEIGILNENGKELFRLSRRIAITDRDLADRSDSVLFREGMKHEIYWGRVMITETSEPWATLAVRLPGPDPLLKGLVFGVINLKSLWNLTRGLKLSHEGRVYIVEENGRLIAAADPSIVLRRLSFADRPLIQQLINPQRSDDRTFVQGDYTNERGVSVVGTGLLLTGPRWGVVIEQPQAVLLAPIQQKIWLFASLSLMGLLLSFGLAYTLSRRLTAPITRLRQGAEQIGGGNLEYRVSVETADEIGGLATEFNRMGEQLSASHQATLSALTIPVISHTSELRDVLSEVIVKVMKVTGAQAASIRLTDDENRKFVFSVYEGFSDAYVQEGPTLVEAGGGKILKTGELFISEDLLNNSGGDRAPLLREGFRSAVCFCLKTTKRSFGVMTLASREAGRLSLKQADLFTAIGHEISVALQNAILFQETEQRARQQEALNAIAAAVSESLKLENIFEIALDKTVEVTGRKRITIRLKDPQSGVVNLVGYRGFAEDEVEKLRRGMLHRGSEQVFASGNSLILNDGGGPGFLKETRCAAWIPVKAGASVIGVLGIGDVQSKPFLPSEVELLQAIGSVIGVAIENARLFGETERNVERLKALRQIDEAITSSLDLNSVLDLLLKTIDLLLPYSCATTVRLVNEESGRLERVASRSIKEKEWNTYMAGGHAFTTDTLLQNRAPFVVNNLQTDPRARDPEFFRREGLVSFLGLPLIAKDKTLGVLSFYTKEEHQFSDEEVQFLTTLAGQAAIAIHNAQLYEAARDRETRLNAAFQEQKNLQEISQAVAFSLDLEAICQTVLGKILSIGSFDLGVIRLLDPITNMLNPVAVKGYRDPGSVKPHSLDPQHSTFGTTQSEIFLGRRPFVIESVESSPGIRTLKREGAQSAIIIPVQTEEQVLGSIQLGSRTPRKFQPNEISILDTAGNQLGLAIQNVRHYEESQRRLRFTRALRDIDMAITSTLDLRAVLDVLAEKTVQLLPDSASLVWLRNPATGSLERAACWNLDEKEWKGRNPTSIPLRVKTAIDTRAPIVIRNVQSDPRTMDSDFYRREGLVSYLGIPLIAKDEVVGVLVFLTREEHEFTRDETEFLVTLAGQAAIAIHNSQLYEQANATNQRLGNALKELSGLYTALGPLAPAETIHETMDRIIDRLMEATGADAALIRLRDPVAGVCHLTSQRGFPDYYLKRVEVAPPGGAVDLVFKNGEPIIAPDIASESRLKGKVQLQAGLHSCAILPLKAHQEVRGVIHLASRQPGYFDQEQRDHLMAIARQMEITLENKDLFDNLQNSKNELEKSNKVKDEFLGVMSHELRTPLTAIVGYTEMTKDGLFGEVTPEQETALEKVMARSKDLLIMINGILQATQLEAGAVKVEAGEVSLKDFLDELRLNYALPLRTDLTIIWEYPADLPLLKTDMEKIKHILQNLINNAIKFTHSGSIKVSAKYLNGKVAVNGPIRKSGHGVIEFQVADTGVGIPKEMLPDIFEMFRQVDSSETRLYGGVGLGLYIVKKYTEVLGGSIEVESEIGKGSTFTVRIPCAPVMTPAENLAAIAAASPEKPILFDIESR